MSILFNLNLKNKNLKLINLLKDIYGLGFKRSKTICSGLGFDSNIRIGELKQEHFDKINSLISLKYKYIIDTDLRKQIYDNIQLSKNLKTYKGIRHLYKLPVNGQNTHNNAKTRRWL